MKTIKLSSNVMVSDPCYSLGTWCQTKLENVLAGNYVVHTIRDDEDPDDSRNWGLVVIHEDYVGKKKRWQKHCEIGVDSGQAGIFDLASYRNDKIFEGITSKFEDSGYKSDGEDGENWYAHMCDRTLYTKESWGSYDAGVVSSSGWGDGSYPVKVQKEKGRIVGIFIDFGITPVQAKFLESLMASS